MRLTANFLKLAFLVIVSIVTLVVVLFDQDNGAQQAMTHAFALALGALLHSLTGEKT